MMKQAAYYDIVWYTDGQKHRIILNDHQQAFEQVQMLFEKGNVNVNAMYVTTHDKLPEA